MLPLTEIEEILLQGKMQGIRYRLHHNSLCPDAGSADSEDVPSPKGITAQSCVERSTKHPYQEGNDEGEQYQTFASTLASSS
jgi:hypothetical protein